MATIYGEVSIVLGLFGIPMTLFSPFFFRELNLAWVIPSIVIIFGIIGIVRDEYKRNAKIGVIFGAFELFIITYYLLIPIQLGL